jgi:hypothetical protein
MNTKILFLFVILLLSLVLCSFLGGNCDNMEGFNNTNRENNRNISNNNRRNEASNGSNIYYDNYNHYDSSSTEIANGSTFYGPNGGSVTIITNSDGTQSLEVILEDGESPIIYNTHKNTTEAYTNLTGPNGSATIFYGPNGESATVINANNGKQAIRIRTSRGTITFTHSGAIINTNNISSAQYYGSTGSNINTYRENASVVRGPNRRNIFSVTGPNRNTAFPNDNSIPGVEYFGPIRNNNSSYFDTLPPGIRRHEIPPGSEDLYILKSQIVPPVCPACPSSTVCPRTEPPPPCPACARCPEPSFECRKVPNYNAKNNYLPVPVLNDFSTFGM